MDFPSQIQQRPCNHRGNSESTVSVSHGGGYFNSCQKCMIFYSLSFLFSPIEKSIFFLHGHKGIIGLKINQLYKHTLFISCHLITGQKLILAVHIFSVL